MDPVRELKIRAEILHGRLASGDAEALARLRALPELRRSGGAVLAATAHVARRKHCLAVVAREHGFSSWEHALRVLDGDPREHDAGTLLYAGEGGVLNHWFASYEEARAFLDAPPRRYLLVYKRDFFVADPPLIESLGLHPDDPDWQAIGWDWARPTEPAARRRLYAKRLAAMRPGAGALSLVRG
jgi:hypothetical protein